LALVLYGADEAGKPHAASFTEADAPLAEKAAGHMGLKVLRLSTDELRRLAGKISAGKIFSSGKAFVPYCNRTIHAQLAAMGGEVPQVEPAPEEAAPEKGAAQNEPSDVPSATPEPAAWGAIKVGSVVLVTEGRPQEGWWEAVVTEIKAGDLLVLRWRDFPEDETQLVRKRQHVALLYPVKA
jgi:hypothetical protein